VALKIKTSAFRRPLVPAGISILFFVDTARVIGAHSSLKKTSDGTLPSQIKD
jgi:hypothetical protein